MNSCSLLGYDEVVLRLSPHGCKFEQYLGDGLELWRGPRGRWFVLRTLSGRQYEEFAISQAIEHSLGGSSKSI
jgi:hypothetical protein